MWNELWCLRLWCCEVVLALQFSPFFQWPNPSGHFNTTEKTEESESKSISIMWLAISEIPFANRNFLKEPIYFVPLLKLFTDDFYWINKFPSINVNAERNLSRKQFWIKSSASKWLRAHLKISDAWKLKRESCNNKNFYQRLIKVTHHFLSKMFFFQAKNEDELWCERSRRRVLRSIMTEWTKLSTKTGTVKNLISALSLPGWFDVKLRVIKLLEENCGEELQWKL